MRRLGLYIASALLGVMVACAARADMLPLWPYSGPVGANSYTTAGSFYFSLSPGVEVQPLPRWNSPISNFFAGQIGGGVGGGGVPLLSASPSMTMLSGTGTLGIEVPQDGFIPGMRPRIEASLGYGQGTAHFSSSTPLTIYIGNSYATWGQVNGGSGQFGSFGSTPTIESSALDLSRTSINGALRMRSDYALGPNFILSPSLGIIAGGDQDIYNLDSVSSPTVTTYQLQEKVGSQRLGGEIGANLTMMLSPAWSLTGGMTGAVFAQHATLAAQDSGFGCFSPQGSCTTSVSQNSDRAAFRVGVQTGVSYSIGSMKISLLGVGAWDSAVPGVANPSYLTNTSGCLGCPVSPARLTFQSEFSYGGFLALTFPLN